MEIEKIESTKEVVSLTTHANASVEYAQKLTIKTEDDHVKAIAALTKISDEKKRGDSMRKFFVDPLSEQVKKVNALFNPSIDALKSAEMMIRNKLSAYQMGLLAKADKAKEKVLKQHEKGKVSLEEAVESIRHVAEPEKTVRTEEATVTYKFNKKIEVVDEAKIPREYLVPDLVKIRKVALAGVAIPGIKVVEEKIPSLRKNG